MVRPRMWLIVQIDDTHVASCQARFDFCHRQCLSWPLVAEQYSIGGVGESFEMDRKSLRHTRKGSSTSQGKRRFAEPGKQK